MVDFWSGVIAVNSAILIAVAFRDRKLENEPLVRHFREGGRRGLRRERQRRRLVRLLDAVALAFTLVVTVLALSVLGHGESVADQEPVRAFATTFVATSLGVVIISYMESTRGHLSVHIAKYFYFGILLVVLTSAATFWLLSGLDVTPQ